MLDRLAWTSVRVIAVILGAVAVGWLVARLRLVVIPVAIALLLVAPLRPLAQRLAPRIGRSLTAIACVLGVVVLGVSALTGFGYLAGRGMAELPDRVSRAATDVQDWLVEGPLGLSRDTVDGWRTSVQDTLSTAVSDSTGGLIDGATVAAEVLAGILLAIVLAIFLLRDADRATEAVAGRLPPAGRERFRRAVEAGWQGLRRFILGAAFLGVVEGLTIGIVLAIVASPTAAGPVAGLTFVAAFFPIVGAIVAGVLATLVALVEAGPAGALIVGATALIVQQIDNDLLAPVIYGRIGQLHPAAILVSLSAGATVAGIAGAFFAVPFATVVMAVHRASRPRAPGALDGQRIAFVAAPAAGDIPGGRPWRAVEEAGGQPVLVATGALAVDDFAGIVLPGGFGGDGSDGSDGSDGVDGVDGEVTELVRQAWDRGLPVVAVDGASAALAGAGLVTPQSAEDDDGFSTALVDVLADGREPAATG